jgi:hypothetical protein
MPWTKQHGSNDVGIPKVESMTWVFAVKDATPKKHESKIIFCILINVKGQSFRNGSLCPK